MGQTVNPDKNDFIALATIKMPFGKYKNIRLVDLPEPYLVWFSRRGYPDGKLGQMLQAVYEIKLNGLEYLFKDLSLKEIHNSHAVKIYTAQYRYSGEDRLDVTVKGKDPVGRIFTPTWKMVMGSKEGKISWDEYRKMYREIMQDSYRQHRDTWNSILNRDEVTLVCFCKADSTCHRYLLADYFTKLGAEYMGERC
jgi:uncharacterized protein (DUF3820 family)